MFTVIFLSQRLRQTQTFLVEAGRTLLTAQQTAALGADEAPVGVDVGLAGRSSSVKPVAV